VHALAALLRNNTSIEEVNLRTNRITDDGARALGAVLAGKSGLRMVDLRGNKIGKGSIRILAEALERAERVRHVYVHAGGKIEALGSSRWAQQRKDYGQEETADVKSVVNVETICVVDVRDNVPEAPSIFENDGGMESNVPHIDFSSTETFNPSQLLAPTGALSTEQLSSAKTALQTLTKKGKKGKGIKKSSTTTDLAGAKDREKVSFNENAKKIKESSWQGRQQGMEKSVELESKESIRLRKNTAIPPLGRENDSSPTRGHSAPGGVQRGGGGSPTQNYPNLTEDKVELVTAAIMKARSTKDKSKKATDVEKRLFNSPFAQPLLK